MVKPIFAGFLLFITLSALAVPNVPTGGKDGGDQGGVGGTQGSGGAQGGVGGLDGGVLLDPDPNPSPVLNPDLVQFGPSDVIPVNGQCHIPKLNRTGPWAKSPCEKLYGPTPIGPTSTGTAGGYGGGSNVPSNPSN